MRPVAASALLHLTQHVGSDGVRLEIAGEIDASTGRYLSGAVMGAVRAGAAHVDLDLGEVTFMDSSGIRELLAARDTARGALRLIAISDVAHRVLEVSGLSAQFDRAPRPDGAGGTA